MSPAGSRGSTEAAGRTWLVIILGALSAFGPPSIDMHLPALPQIGRDFAASALQVQVTLNACVLGLALGQMIAGPLSDAVGRRRPLLIHVAAYAVASLLCMAAPSPGALIALRFMQGLAGAAGIVISRAVVRDLQEGVAAAHFFSLLMLVNGLAPLIDGPLRRATSWRGIFAVLSLIGALLLAGTASGLRETLAAGNRRPSAG